MIISSTRTVKTSSFVSTIEYQRININKSLFTASCHPTGRLFDHCLRLCTQETNAHTLARVSRKMHHLVCLFLGLQTAKGEGWLERNEYFKLQLWVRLPFIRVLTIFTSNRNVHVNYPGPNTISQVGRTQYFLSLQNYPEITRLYIQKTRGDQIINTNISLGRWN